MKVLATEINVVDIGRGDLANARLVWYDGTGREVFAEAINAVNTAEEALQLVAQDKGLSYEEAYGADGLGHRYIEDVTLIMLWYDAEM